MIVHILGTKSLLTADFYQLISKSPDHNDHWFVTGMPHHSVWKNGQTGAIVGSKSLKMLAALYRSDGIVVHGLINPSVLLIFACQPWLLKKTNWVVWGGDLYVHRFAQESLKTRLIERLRRFVLPRFGFVTTLIDGEYELAQKWYGVQGKPLRATYPVNLHQTVVPLEPRSLLEQREVSILVGNSATKTNHHMEALDYLEQYRDERIRIVLPLSYGFDDYESYAENVIHYAQKKFGESAVCPLTERMPTDEYTAMLSSIDVGVFNNDRQQGMGNIFQLMRLGAKIYLRQGTLMWNHYIGMGCVVHAIDEIPGMSFDGFAYQSDGDSRHNFDIVTSRNDLDVKIKQWQEVFAQMRFQTSKVTNRRRGGARS